MQPFIPTAPPHEFLCPISLDVMVDPVTLSSGITFDRRSIVSWLASGHRYCPVSRQPLGSLAPALVPNLILRRLIEKWTQTNRAHDSDTSIRQNVAKSCKSSQHLNEARCILDAIVCGNARVEGIERLHIIARENARDIQILSSTRADVAITCLLRTHGPKVRDGNAEAIAICTEAIAALSYLSIGDEAREILFDDRTVDCLVSIFCEGRSAFAEVFTLKILSQLVTEKRRWFQNQRHATARFVRALLQTTRRPGAREDSLEILLLLFSRAPDHRLKHLEVEAIPFLLELLTHPNIGRRAYKRSLALLNLLLSSAECLASALAHGLTVSLLVKNILRVSKATTRSAVEALFKMCQAFPTSSVFGEALQADVLHKLLVVVRTDDAPSTKKMVAEVLDLLLYSRLGGSEKKLSPYRH